MATPHAPRRALFPTQCEHLMILLFTPVAAPIVLPRQSRAMIFVCGFALCAIFLTASQYLYQRWSLYVALRSAMRQRGCQKAPRYPHRDRWGYDLSQQRIQAFASGEGQKIYEQHFEKYGKTFEERFFDRKIITTMDPANIQHVLGIASRDFSKNESRTRRSIITKFIGPGILTATGAGWKHSRDLVKPIFSRGELADVNIIGKHVDRLMNVLPRDKSTIDAQQLLQDMFLDSASEFLLGEPLNTLSKDSPAETRIFLDTYEQASAGFARYRKAPRLSYLRYMLPNDYDKACKRLHRFLDKHVKRALQETTSCHKTSGENASEEKPADPSQRYIFINEVAKKIRDPFMLRSEVTNVFFVARENVAMVTANALFYLARNPSLWNDLRRIAIGLGDQPLTFELVRSLNLFRYVYNETLRVQGPSVMLVRTAVNNSILPTGGGPEGNSPVFVEKGTEIVCNNWSLHHDKDIWGEDAQEFKPQRWHGRQPPIWEFIPFGGGPRICPALQQVFTHFAFTMVRLAQEFETIENRDPVAEYVVSFKLTAESRNGVKIALIPAGV